MSVIDPSSDTGTGAWVNSKMYTSILLYNIINCHAGVSHKYIASSFIIFFTCIMCVFCSRSFWTSISLDVPAGVTQEEGHTGFLIHLLSTVRALLFLARRIQPFISLVDREVEFCVLTI